MRSNSGNGTSQNNNSNPTLRDAEREKGVSGNAIHNEKKAARTASRKTVRDTGANTSP
ncbi:MAG TPA: hypothetical protein VNT25_04745 [Allosphingosinicella sp.]|nr:hypothetical protein [Allosphingosinicella sp.]